MNHLLLHYSIAYELWSMVWNLFGLQWVMPHGVSDLSQVGKVPLVGIGELIYGGLSHIVS